MKELNIPEERIGVIIGSDGETKQEFEELTDCTLTLNDNTAQVEGEPLDEMNAIKVVRAIGRGFNPEKAFKILERDHTLYVIDIDRYANNKNSRERLKGRVIGRDGEAKRHIEKMTETELSIYGSTIGIIGDRRNIETVHEAIKMLLKGSSHATAYNYLEKNQDKIKR